MRPYRKLPDDERRRDEDSEYIFEHRTERRIPPFCFAEEAKKGLQLPVG